MADTGWVIVGTGANVARTGSAKSWNFPGQWTANDGLFAETGSMFGPSDYSDYLKGTNLGLSVPSGDTIDGIQVQVETNGRSGGTHIFDIIQLVDDLGNIVGTNQAGSRTWSDTGTVDTFPSSGDTTNLWGASWTPTQVNDVDFGVVVSAKQTANPGTSGLRTDYAAIKVFHSAGGGGGATIVPGPTFMGM